MRTLIEYVSVTIPIDLLSEDDISYQHRIPISKIPTAFPLHPPTLIAVSTCRNKAGYQCLQCI